MPAAPVTSHRKSGHGRSVRSGREKADLRRALKRNPDNIAALHALGLMAREEGRLDYAIQLLTRATAQAPDKPQLHCDLGNAMKEAGRLDESIESHRRALALVPTSPIAMSNLGSAYKAAGRMAEALECLRKTVSIQPEEPEFHYNLGNALHADGRFGDAVDSFRAAVARAPNHLRARLNLGVCLREDGKLAESISIFRGILAQAPDADLAGYSLSLALLMNGDYAEGWPLYEWRRRIPDFAMRRLDGPDWTGDALDGRKILVHAEQGLGDTIQFARYLAPLSRLDGAVTLLCPGALKPLLSQAPGMPAIVDDSEPLPGYEVQAPLMSLPHLMGNQPPYVPETGPYLRAAPERIETWRTRLCGARRRIGIAWQGRPEYKADFRRSIPLAAFAPLAEIPDVSLICLQKGPGTDQIPGLPWRDRITDPGPDLDADGAFLDTAAIMAGLDVVITSDTSIAHLAGALGVETRVALARVPDWRWGLRGGGCPWYPSMRLYRQSVDGDWAGVFARIAEDLK